MKRYLRTVALVLIALVLVVAVLTFGFLRGWHIKKHTPEELAPLLKPYFQIKTPEGEGPFPTIIGFHGCGGLLKGGSDWADYLVELGYATILVDSFTGRGFTTLDDIKDVCAGRKLWGSERAGDVLVALDEARKLPFVDTDQLALFGWSHGAWTIMDLFAMDPPHELPTNLKRSPDQPLAGVKAAVLCYPYCKFPAKARRRGWTHDIEVLMLMAGKDSMVSTEACLEIVSVLEKSGRPIRTHVYPSIDHAFDMRDEDLKKLQLPFVHNPEATRDARKRVKRFLAEVFCAR
jgi:dienelactone hydrolase